jgi:hypothetical protein
MPAGVYNIIRKASGGAAPINLTAVAMVRTSQQVAEELLCHECERRLNDNGERWFLKNCFQGGTNFPLRDLFARSRPLETGGDFTAYNGRGVLGPDLDKLIYFGASIFWRAGAHEWRSVVKGEPTSRVVLGEYEEALRLYLLGGKFPERIALLVTVHGKGAILASNATAVDRNQHYSRFYIDVLGVNYILIVGDIPGDVATLSVTQAPDHIVCTTMRRFNEEKLEEALMKATPRGKLASSVRRWRAGGGR